MHNVQENSVQYGYVWGMQKILAWPHYPCRTYVICVCLRTVVSNTCCVLFLLCYKSSYYVPQFSGLFIFDCPFGIIYRLFCMYRAILCSALHFVVWSLVHLLLHCLSFVKIRLLLIVHTWCHVSSPQVLIWVGISESSGFCVVFE